MGRRRGGLAGSRTGRQDRGRGRREARPLPAAIPSGLEARQGKVRARGPADAGPARPSPRPLRRGDARLVRAGQAARQLDDPVPAPPHRVPRARPHLGDAGPGPDGQRLRRMTVRLDLTRAQILAFRRHVGALDQRLPPGPRSLRRAAWAGLQDSMPRAALLSIHARVAGVPPSVLDDPALVQVWGPRYSAYAIATADIPIFTLSRMPDDERGRRRAESTADLLEKVLDGRR